jgi:hypothetical protein
VGGVALTAVVALPWILWHRAIAAVAADFRLDLNYLTGWIPFILILMGIGFLVPVAASAGRDPESRWYPQARKAYLGWGVTLYLLGCALATQVAQITDGLTSP